MATILANRQSVINMKLQDDENKNKNNFFMQESAQKRSCLKNTLNTLISAKHTKAQCRPKHYEQLAVVLGGIGSQWIGMGKKLIHASLIFRDTMVRLTSVIKNEVNSKFEDFTNLFSTGSKWNRKKYMGIGIVAYQIAIINIFKKAGIKPDFIIGHSIGETSAGYLAGLTSERETILIQYVQSVELTALIKPNYHLLKCQTKIGNNDQNAEIVEELILNDKSSNYYYYIRTNDLHKYRSEGKNVELYDLTGKMAYVGLSKKEIQAAIDELNLNQVCVACENSPHGQTVSGSLKQVDILHGHFISTFRNRNDGTKLFWRDLNTDQVAYHAKLFSIFYEWLVQKFQLILSNNKHIQNSSNSSSNDYNYSNNGCGTNDNNIRKYGWLSSSSDVNNNSNTMVFDACYHAQTVVSSVKFQRCIETLSMLPKTTLVMEIGSSSSLLGQVNRVDNQLGTLGFVKHGVEDDEGKYLDVNELRICIFKNGYIDIFRNSIMCQQIKNEITASMEKIVDVANLLHTVKDLNDALSDIDFLKKEKHVNVNNAERALCSIIKAPKPREKIVAHILRRTWIRCVCDPYNNIPIFYTKLKEFTHKDNELYNEKHHLIIHAKNILMLLQKV